MNVYFYITLLLIGMCIGFLVGLWILKGSKMDGRLIIDESNSDKTRWTLDIDREPEEIKKKKVIQFTVYIKK